MDSIKLELLGFQVDWDKQLRKHQEQLSKIVPPNTFVRLLRGFYKGFYAKVIRASLNDDKVLIDLKICRKDRDGWIQNDRMDARRYYRVSELEFDIDANMLTKLRKSYDNSTLSN